MTTYQYRAGWPTTIQELEQQLERVIYANEDDMYGVPDEQKSQAFLDQRPHRLPWNRKWID